jgi:hypothetical protein
MVELATTLRGRFDPAYIMKEIGDVTADLHDRDHRSYDTQSPPPQSERAVEYQRRAAAAIEAFDAWLANANLPIANEEQKRAARTAFHVNYDGMRQAFFDAKESGIDVMTDPAFRQPLNMVLARPHPWTYLLIDVRMLHVLARIRRSEYEQLVRQLGQYEAQPQRTDAKV